MAGVLGLCPALGTVADLGGAFVEAEGLNFVLLPFPERGVSFSFLTGLIGLGEG